MREARTTARARTADETGHLTAASALTMPKP